MVTIDSARPDDDAALKRTLAAAFTRASVEDFGVEGVLPPGVDDGTMIDTAYEEQEMYTIRDGDEIVGGVIVEQRPDDEMYLQTLWVDPASQRSGIGSAAMTFLEAAHPDASIWTLETPKLAERNRRFYEGHGYEVVAEEGVEGEDVVLLTYQKELA